MNEENKITIVAPATMSNKVSCIKAIRWLTGLGLKEAKDASERPSVRQTFARVSSLPVNEENEQIRILRSEGFEVGPSVFLILEELRKLGSQALLQGEDELASEILQLVMAEKLRRKPN